VRAQALLDRAQEKAQRRVLQAFPDGLSALTLVAARLRHIASTKWGKRRYLAMETLPHPLPEGGGCLRSDRATAKKCATDR
jgi:hypothetical protein